MMPEHNEAETVIAAAVAIGSTRYAGVSGAPYTVVPGDYSVESLEKFLEAPTRIKREAILHDPESFVEYLKRFREPSTLVFFDQGCAQFRAILDYHGPVVTTAITGETGGETVDVKQNPRWCDHKAFYAPRATDEWAAWVQRNGIPMKQVDFARFLEDHVDDIADDGGPTLLKIALTLEIKNSVSYTSSHRLEDGSVRLLYEEDVKGTASTGQIAIPPIIVLKIQPFAGGPTYRVQCRLRYALKNRAAEFWFEIVHLQKVTEMALAHIRHAIEEASGVKILAGVPGIPGE